MCSHRRRCSFHPGRGEVVRRGDAKGPSGASPGSTYATFIAANHNTQCDGYAVVLVTRAQVVAVAGVVALDDARRLLLVRRRDGGWTHPAGRVEFGETWAEAALREFSEETGGRVELQGLLGAYSDPATQLYQYPSGERVHFVGVAFRARVLSLGTPDVAEILDMGWFRQSSLPAPVFGPARPIIMDAFARVYERVPVDDQAERDLPDTHL